MYRSDYIKRIPIVVIITAVGILFFLCVNVFLCQFLQLGITIAVNNCFNFLTCLAIWALVVWVSIVLRNIS